jgi:hypothetical protein
MKFALHCIGEGLVAHFTSMDDVWVYARENGLCSEEIFDDELPPRRILNPSYEIRTFATDGELIAMSRVRLSDASQEDWQGSWPDK